MPSTRSRKTLIPYDRQAYRARNLVERLWCRLKDWRRIATRYDKLAANHLAGVLIAAVITFWCDRVLTLGPAFRQTVRPIPIVPEEGEEFMKTGAARRFQQARFHEEQFLGRA